MKSNLFTPILIAGSLILLLGFAIRSTFGLFQIPIAEEFLWARSEFSLAIAIQNLAWGIGTPIFSAFAEKYGDRKAITIGLILYALGVFISSTASSPEAHQFLNVLIGFGIAGSGFGPILGVIGRSASPEKRSLALGIATAAGSAGQVIGPPFAAILLSIVTHAQSISYSNDSVVVIHQYNTPPGSDTTDMLWVVNNGVNPLSLKVELYYEDVSPGFAIVEYFDVFPHQMMSNSGIGLTDSVVVQGSDSIGFKAVFPSSGPQIINKVKLKVYDPLDSANSSVILTFAEVVCPAPNGNVIINPSGSYCSTDSVFLSASSNYSGYQWSTGDTAQTIYVPANMPVYIDASDSLKCITKDTSNIC